MEIYCNTCGLLFYKTKSEISRTNKHFCSRSCYLNRLTNQTQCDNCGLFFNKSLKHSLRQKKNFCCKECWQCFDDSYNKNFFSSIDSEEKAYWLGMIGADGWLCERDNSLGLDLKINDREHVQKLSKLFNVGVYDYSGIKSRCMVYSKTIFRDLVKKGITPRKTLKDNIEVFNHIPECFINHFVRGWFDGDGHICFRKKIKTIKCAHKYDHYQFGITGTNNVLEKFLYIIKKGACINPKVKLYKCRSVKSLKIGGKQVSNIGNWLYKDATIWLERKKKVFEEINENLLPV